MKVSHRYDQNLVLFLSDLINDTIRKAIGLTPASIPTNRLPRIRILFYSFDCCPNFLKKLKA